MTWDGDLMYLFGFVAFFATPFLVYLVLLSRGAVHLGGVLRRERRDAE